MTKRAGDIKSLRSAELRRILMAGGAGVLPTDTMYGVVGSAMMPLVVERIYKLRQRDLDKPMIVLIGDWSHLRQLGIRLTPVIKKRLEKVWPGPVSVILPCTAKKFEYLHRGHKTLALRWPKRPGLQSLLRAVGPLVAPSANRQAGEPATTLSEAKKVFGEQVDFYVEGGRLPSSPSTLIRFTKQGVEVLRQGIGRVRG